MHCLQDLLTAINAAGASQISFNALTKLNINKALQQISSQAGFSLPADTLNDIADSANGDLCNAIETLQLAAAGVPVDLKAAKGQKGKVQLVSTAYNTHKHREFIGLIDSMAFCVSGSAYGK